MINVYHEFFSRNLLSFEKNLIFSSTCDEMVKMDGEDGNHLLCQDLLVLEDTQFPRSVLHHINRWKTGNFMVKELIHVLDIQMHKLAMICVLGILSMDKVRFPII